MPRRLTGKQEVWLFLSSISALCRYVHGCEWSASCPSTFTPLETAPDPQWLGRRVGPGNRSGHIDWYLLTAVGLTPGGSSTVHIYTQTIHRTTQNAQNNTINIVGEKADLLPVLEFELQTPSPQLSHCIDLAMMFYDNVLQEDSRRFSLKLMWWENLQGKKNFVNILTRYILAVH